MTIVIFSSKKSHGTIFLCPSFEDVIGKNHSCNIPPGVFIYLDNASIWSHIFPLFRSLLIIWQQQDGAEVIAFLTQTCLLFVSSSKAAHFCLILFWYFVVIKKVSFAVTLSMNECKLFTS